MAAERHLVTIAHSYVVAENRRLAHEMALAGRGRWRVTAIAPSSFRGDLRQIDLEPLDGEACEVIPLEVRRDRIPHLMSYRGLRGAFAGGADVVHCWEEPYVFAGAQIARRVRGVPARDGDLSEPAEGLPVAAVGVRAREHAPRRRMDCLRYTVAEASRRFPTMPRSRTRDSSRRGRRAVSSDPRPARRCGSASVDEDAPSSATSDGSRRRRRDRSVRGARSDGVAVARAVCRRRRPAGRARAVCRATRAACHIATDVQHSEVPHWLNAMTLLCAPSCTTTAWRSSSAGCSSRAWRAASRCWPATAAKCPSWSVTRDTSSRGDPDTWARALDRHLADPETRGLMSARHRARHHFAWPVVARRHLDFFDALLEARAQP